MSNQPLASLSIDLDNKWSYLKTHGSDAWETFPSYFETVVPRLLNFMNERNLKLTVFVVGQDAELEKNRASLRSIADAGHEIANHSFNHEPWLHLYTPDELVKEISKAEQAIKQATGKHPVGFRGPGFSLTNELLKILMQRGYRYDCTTFPTFIGPVARMYYFFKSNLSRQEKDDRKELFGSWKQGFQSNHPFRWVDGDRTMPEIPVTTMPFFKVPIHASYIHYLAQFSTALAKLYFRIAMMMCRLAGVRPSFLLHPLDFLGKDDEPDLLFFPGMNQPAQKKIKLLGECIDLMAKHFQVVTMDEHASAISGKKLRQRPVTFAATGLPGKLAEAEG